jgi:Transglycosylase SLT domain
MIATGAIAAGWRRRGSGVLRRILGNRWLLVAGTLIGAASGRVEAGSFVAGGKADLDRVALAVAGIESTYGTDTGMWRADPDGPQGPMQVSAAAALDAGGGDRFDAVENETLGRAYLSGLYRHYRNWPDAVAAYNWGPGNMDTWIEHGRASDAMPAMVALYRFRVMRVALFGPDALGPPQLGAVHRQPRRSLADLRYPSRATIVVEHLYGAILRLAAPELR